MIDAATLGRGATERRGRRGLNGPGRWDEIIRTKWAPLTAAAEARTYLDQWREAQRRVREFGLGSNGREALEAAIEDLRGRYLAAVRSEITPGDTRLMRASDMDG